MILGRSSELEPPWGVEPQTYALRVDLQLSARVARGDCAGRIHPFGRSTCTSGLDFVDRFVDKSLTEPSERLRSEHFHQSEVSIASGVSLSPSGASSIIQRE